MAKQTCLYCGKTTDNGPDVPALQRCPKCLKKFQKPIVIQPKTGEMGAQGQR